ncbi:ATP-binding protein [Candidatus Micrarchaeota archaeon]|nr:ATP-binding protein [Candidatus Micrarchaeota archaeon]
MDEENIKKIILKYKDLIPKKILERDLQIYESELDKAIIIVGPRRAGKTYYLYGMIKKEIEKDCVLVNFEDNLLGEMNSKDLNKIPDYSKELFSKEKLVFFFDELQGVKNWERFVISLLNEHYKVTITGSNSKLLSKEIATSLRGKSLSYLLLPFSFSEYLKAKNIELKKNFEHSDQVFEIKKQFEDYLKYGGFPELALTESLPLKNKLINNYFDSILYKDLVERLDLKNIRLVDITMKYILNLFGNTFSISAFERYLKTNKVPYSLEDLYHILKSLEDVFMVSYVREYSKSFKKSEFSKSKVYLFDTGYIHFLAKEAEDFGRILENLVFIELFRKQAKIENKDIFYYKSAKGEECDFVITSKGTVNEAIQVTYALTENNRKREIDGIMSAMESFGLKNGIIMTRDQDENLKINGKKIMILPVWKWLLA